MRKWSCGRLLILVSLLTFFVSASATHAQGETGKETYPPPTDQPEIKLATGGPDSFGYTFLDRNSPGGPNSRGLRWTDISATGTALPLAGDDVTASIPIFPFAFYGVTYTTLTICTNGYVAFGTTTTCDYFPHSPTAGEPVNYVAGWWEDLDGACAGSQFDYQTLGTAPNRRLVVQYTTVGHLGNCAASATFQILLHESSNAVEVLHNGTVGTDAGTHYVEIGMSSSSPAPLTAYSGTTAPGADWAVLFMPPPGNTSAATWSCRTPHLAIPDGPSPAVSDDLLLSNPSNLRVVDVNVYLNMPHVFLGDMQVILTHVDTGTSVTLFDRQCGGSDYIVAGTVDDEAASLPTSCNGFPAIALTGGFRPAGPLSNFDGQSYGGTWRLSLQDLAGTDLGTLSQWCFNATTAPPNRYVSATGSNTGNTCLVQGAPCATISHAIAQAFNDGTETILIAGGTYPESVDINKNVIVGHWAAGGGGNDIDILSFTQSAGTFNAPPGQLRVAGNFTRSGGTFNAGTTNTLLFDGATTQNLTLNLATTFRNLTVLPNTLLVETVAANNATVAGTLTNQHIIRKTLPISGVGANTFGLTLAQLNVTTRGTLSSVQIDRTAGNHPNAPTPIQTGQFWRITPTGAGYTVGLTLPHAGYANPSVCRFNNPTWYCDRSSFTGSTVTYNGITQLSDWAVGNNAPLLAQLATFEASHQGAQVVVTWETALEVDNLGFNLYRSTSVDAPEDRLNTALIPSQAPGSGQGAAYQWTDTTIQPDTSYFYWLESVDTLGQATLHGPVSAAPATAITLTTLRASETSPIAPLLALVLLAGVTLSLWQRRAR